MLTGKERQAAIAAAHEWPKGVAELWQITVDGQILL